jgi:hypothetical protein
MQTNDVTALDKDLRVPAMLDALHPKTGGV